MYGCWVSLLYINTLKWYWFSDKELWMNLLNGVIYWTDIGILANSIIYWIDAGILVNGIVYWVEINDT